ncbi:MAG: BlaI/MecI/CopY family transcriptional regulator [Armatimonadota bacterium]|nr:BlaI/MecI/CopY family transcriptional regulator [Armatimonadota bacterium]
MNDSIRRTRPEKTGVRAPLGELETAVMRQIWTCGQRGCQGSDVQRALESEKPVALTTVLTTLERLIEKGILYRKREGRAFRYWALLSEDQLQERIVDGVLSNLIARFPRAVAAYLVQQGFSTTAAEPDALATLARRVETLEGVQRAESETGEPETEPNR